MIKKKRVRRKRRSRYQRGVHVSPKAGECSYRSGWEKRYMEWLDTNESVISYEYEKLVIPYLSNAKTKKIRRYFPDFQVKYADGHIEIVEIKPLKRTTRASVMKKSHAAQEWCKLNGATFVVLTEIELKALALL